ncbi:fibronectin type III domain-containing protein 10 [Dunckerocampus dactyliophorus]|uniref:fibronectin type III domain-containing protein 10 n=1 Tax=Dunckerocampus dactyliophorus TaxID=161453 RepID=UPI002406AAF1|nr:fibronectin type III domain-containing protein 10 [Dunckerocampus dactyliophorus]
MSSQLQRPSVLALAALLLCTSQDRTHGGSSASPTGLRGREDSGMQGRWRHGNSSLEGTTSGFFNSSPGDASAVMSEQSPPLCAYQVMEGGIGGPLCFRHTLSGYTCHKADCRSAVSSGRLAANILLNGSVLLQWSQDGDARGSPGHTPSSLFAGRRHRRGGYELSCRWNGSYTQFECAGVHLGAGCRDFLLSELHENIPYRVCLRAPARRDERGDCVEFVLPPSGMQDIVIAMTTVGGAICVMLVIICLLVAYITENIMSPSTQHTYSYRTRSRH